MTGLARADSTTMGMVKKVRARAQHAFHAGPDPYAELDVAITDLWAS